VDECRPVEHGVPFDKQHRRQGGSRRRRLPADTPAARRKGDAAATNQGHRGGWQRQYESSKIRLAFAHVGGGLKSRDGKPLSEFEIAGADNKFVPAEATIGGDTLVVEVKEVASPTQVRFGWRNLANPNLVNKEGLPASPFQTNGWQGGTGE